MMLPMCSNAAEPGADCRRSRASGGGGYRCISQLDLQEHVRVISTNLQGLTLAFVDQIWFVSKYVLSLLKFVHGT